MGKHDVNFSYLFDHPELVEALLREILAPPWVEDIRWETLTKEDTKLQIPGLKGLLKRLRADRIWSVDLRSGGRCVLLFLEFQSKVERFMAVRHGLYVLAFYEVLVRSKRLGPNGKLPPVLPIVIYSGGERWTAPLKLSELIDLSPGHPLWRFQPEFEYPVVISAVEGRVEPRAKREGGESLLRLIFAIDTAEGEGELRELIARLDKRLEGCDDGLEETVLTWLKNCVAMLLFKESPGAVNDREVNSMLEERLRTWRDEYIQEGLAAGLEQGRLEGARLSLEHLVTARFGSVTWGAVKGDIQGVTSLERLESVIVEAASALTAGAFVEALEPLLTPEP